MKKILLILLVAVFMISCPGTPPVDNGEPLEEPPPDPIPLKLIAIGDDFTMGIQSAGLSESFQINSFPNIVAAQAGLSDSFEQPVVSLPGIGMPPYFEPLGLDGSSNQITYELLPEDIEELELLATLLPLLTNSGLRRPYNNLGINGAKLSDLTSTTGFGDSVPPGNFFFDIVLRNLEKAVPGVSSFGGITVVEQAVLLDTEVPSYETIIMLWIGINDIVGATITGGDIITPAAFDTQYRALLTSLLDITDNIIVANLPSYVPFFYLLDDIFVGGQAMMFRIFDMLEAYGDGDLLPADFGDAGVLNIPLLVEPEEGDAEATHLLLNAGFDYWLNGVGIPEESELLGTYGLDPSLVNEIIGSRTKVGTAFTADQTLTGDEVDELIAVIDACNTVILNAASDFNVDFNVTMVDINAIMSSGGTFGGYSDNYYLEAPSNTFFSLDALHPSSVGYAVIANAFIEAINALGLADVILAPVNPDDYLNQYATD